MATRAGTRKAAPFVPRSAVAYTGAPRDPGMPSSSGDTLILFAAALVAGAVNAIAGGGSLLTFPVLVWLGREPILANATNTVSLSPGSFAALHGFRQELVGLRRWIVRGTLPSVAGGLLGALLLLHTPAPVFEWLVPYLILLATALFAVAGPVAARAGLRTQGDGRGTPVAPRWLPVLGYQFLVSVYGGYFGAGIGIMMLAGLALSGFTAIHRMIALRNYYAILINAVAAVYFIGSGAVQWSDAAVLTAGQIVGGFAGARAARRLPAAAVHWIVVGVGMAMAAALLVRG